MAAFFMLAVLAEVFGVVLAGYASASKWSLFGGVREAAQVVSYEVPRAMCVVVPICVAGTLNLNTIGVQQTGWFWNWNLFHDPFTFVAFFIFFITATASCKRAPFDLAEAESELVAGFHTEYSGLRWSIFFLAEYGSMFAVSGLAALLFLGGWHTGFLPFEPSLESDFWLGNILNIAVFIGKCWVLVLVMMWMRWSLPRLRIDQVMETCLQYFPRSAVHPARRSLPVAAAGAAEADQCELLARRVPIVFAASVPFLRRCRAAREIARCMGRFHADDSEREVGGIALVVTNARNPDFHIDQGAFRDDVPLSRLVRRGRDRDRRLRTGVVLSRNVVRMAVWLLFTLIGVSLLYFLLALSSLEPC